MQSQPSSSGTIPAATAAVMKSRRPPDEEAPYARERVQGPTSFTSAPSTSPWATAALPQPQHSQCVDAAGRTAAQWSFLQFLADTSIVTALGVSLLLYTQIAKVACGLLMCVNVGQTPRWVLDVRLQCPSLPPYPACGAGVVVFGVFLVLGCLAWPVTLAGVLICHAHQGRLLLLGSSQPAASTTVAQHAHTKDASHAAGGVGRTSGAGTALLACTAQYADTNSRSAVRATARLAVRYSDYGVDFKALDVAGQHCQESSSSKGSFRAFSRSPSMKHLMLAGQRLRLYAVLVWDSVLDLHRFLLALVSLCVMLHELHQLILVVLVLGSYLLLVLLVKPFRSVAV